MAIKNILVLGSFKPGAIEFFFVNGFRKFDVNVTTYDVVGQYYSLVGNNILNKVVNKISPDFFF